MPDSALELAIEKHQEALQSLARFIAAGYEPPIEPSEAYEMLVDAIRKGRGDIIEKWRFGYMHFPHIPLQPVSAPFLFGAVVQIYDLIKPK